MLFQSVITTSHMNLQFHLETSHTVAMIRMSNFKSHSRAVSLQRRPNKTELSAQWALFGFMPLYIRSQLMDLHLFSDPTSIHIHIQNVRKHESFRKFWFLKNFFEHGLFIDYLSERFCWLFLRWWSEVIQNYHSCDFCEISIFCATADQIRFKKYHFEIWGELRNRWLRSRTEGIFANMVRLTFWQHWKTEEIILAKCWLDADLFNCLGLELRAGIFLLKFECCHPREKIWSSTSRDHKGRWLSAFAASYKTGFAPCWFLMLFLSVTLNRTIYLGPSSMSLFASASTLILRIPGFFCPSRNCGNGWRNRYR